MDALFSGQKQKIQKWINSVAGTRTRVSRVRAEYPNQLDYDGAVLRSVISYLDVVS